MELPEDERGTVVGVEKAENNAMEQLIISIDGTTEDIVNRVIQMKGVDYDFVIETLSGIANGLGDEKKAISDGSTRTSSEEGKQT